MASAETRNCVNNEAEKIMTESIAQLKGLIIAQQWINLILSGKKTWEMRSKVTSYRGPLAIIQKGSGVVSGIVDLIDCIPEQHEAEYGASEALHCIPKTQHRDCASRWPVAWVFANARSLVEPVPYQHKKGAQSQVVLSKEESAAVQSHDPGTRDTGSAASVTASHGRHSELINLPSLGNRHIRLTKSSIENGYISLSSSRDFFPPDVIGGSNRASAAPQTITMIFRHGSVQTDIDGAHWIPRDRTATRDFFRQNEAKAGDVIIVDRLAAYVYAFSFQK